MLWLASATSVPSRGLSRGIQMSLFNQLLLNRMRGETHSSKNQEPFSKRRVKSDDL